MLVIYFFVINIFQSAFLELTHDEAYYYFYSKHLAFGYYDHPPMVGWLIWLGTTLFGHNEVGVRFFFNIMQVGSVVYLWKLGGCKSPKLFALLTSSFPLFVSAGIFALPDTPLLFFSTAFLFHVQSFKKNESFKNTLLLVGIITCAFYSKYHALLVILLVTFSNLGLLKSKKFWLIVASVCLLYLPHIFWQYEHYFVTIDFHLNQRSGKGFSISNVTEFLGSTFIICGGFAFFNIIKASFVEGRKSKDLLYNSLYFLFIILCLSFRNKIEANWIVTASTFLIPLTCIYYEKRTKTLINGLITPLFLIVIAFRFILIQPEVKLKELGIDRLSEVKSWKRISKEVEEVAAGQKMYADTYQVAAKISFYLKKDIHALHIKGRKSHYSLVPVKLLATDRFTYVTTKRRKGGIKIPTGYKQDIYIYKDVTYDEVKKVLIR